jgi:hypothetical protein
MDINFAYIDLSSLESSSAESWLLSLCRRLSRQLQDLVQIEDVAIPKNASQWREYLSCISSRLAQAKRRLTIILDEVGSSSFPASLEFFIVLRDIYNSRQIETELNSINFLLIGSFHPRELISNDRISPFNIAQRVRIPDFTKQQIVLLVQAGGFSEKIFGALSEKIFFWTGGQPYLTQLFCHYLLDENSKLDVDLVAEKILRSDYNHLPHIIDKLQKDPTLFDYVSRILKGEKIRFYPAENRKQGELELLGVIKENDNGYCVIRNNIYNKILLSITEANKPTHIGGYIY